MCRSNGSLLGTPESLLWVHFWQNVLRIGCYILSSSLHLGSKQRISSDFGNQRYLIGVIDTGCICGVMRLPPGDYFDGWLGMGDDKILGGGSIQMGLHGDKFLRHGACLVLSSPWEMGGFWWHTPIIIWSSAPPPPPPRLETIEDVLHNAKLCIWYSQGLL